MRYHTTDVDTSSLLFPSFLPRLKSENSNPSAMIVCVAQQLLSGVITKALIRDTSWPRSLLSSNPKLLAGHIVFLPECSYPEVLRVNAQLWLRCKDYARDHLRRPGVAERSENYAIRCQFPHTANCCDEGVTQSINHSGRRKSHSMLLPGLLVCYGSRAKSQSCGSGERIPSTQKVDAVQSACASNVVEVQKELK